MITLKKYAQRLIDKWIIDPSEVEGLFVNTSQPM
jgi:hypothetical protein